MGSEPFDSIVTRKNLRATTVFALPPTVSLGPSTRTTSPTETIYLGRLAQFYDMSSGQLPRIAASESFESAHIPTVDGDIQALKAHAWLLSAPDGQLLASLTLDFRGGLSEAIATLEAMYYQLPILPAGQLGDWVAGRLADLLGEIDWAKEFEPDRHQLLFIGADHYESFAREDAVQKLVYRANLPYVKEFSEIEYPGELNRRPTSRCALSPFVSVFIGQQDYIENMAWLSAAMITGANARLRQIGADATKALRSFRETTATLNVLAARRRSVALSDQLSELQLDLSFSVEALADVGLLVPSLRVDAYHRSLAAATGLNRRTTVVAEMLTRLDSAVRAAEMSLAARQREEDDIRRLRWSVPVAVLSAIAVPLGILFGYFGANVAEVDPSVSIFDWDRNRLIYLLVLGIALAGLGSAAFVHFKVVKHRIAQRDGASSDD